MELHQLEYLREIARLESFSRAAETLHITQSALSKSIAKLETEIGVKLFSRQGNRIQLNQFGRVLLSYGEEALIKLDSGMSQVRTMAELETRKVRVGLSADVFIKHLVRDYLLEHPDDSVFCFLQTKEQMLASLSQGQVDFCLTTDPLPGENLTWTPLYEDHLTILMPADHPLASREFVYLREFSEERFIITNLGFGMHSSTYDFCHAVGFEPKILYEGYDTEIASVMIEAGAAVEITPHSISMGVSRFLGGSPRPNINIVPLADSFTNKTIGYVTAKGHYQSPAAKEFYQMVSDYFTSIG